MEKREGKLRNPMIESRYSVFVPAPRRHLPLALKSTLKDLTGQEHVHCAGVTQVTR